MYLYVILCSLFFWALLETLNVKIFSSIKIYKYVYVLYIIFFIILSGIRWEVGLDWDIYLDYYYDYGPYPNSGYLEPLFTFMNWINYNYLNYHIQLLEIGVLSIVPVAWRYEKMSPYPLLTLFIWFSIIFAHIFPVRQTISVALVVFGWIYIEKKKPIMYILIVFLAFLFHSSSLLALPLYFIWNIRLERKTIIMIMLLTIIISFTLQSFLRNLLTSFGDNFIQDKLNFYLNSTSNFGSKYSLGEVLFRGIINRSFFILIPLFLLNQQRKNNNILNAIFNLLIYSYMLFVLFTPFSMALGRITVFSDMAQALLIPYLFTLKIENFSKIIICIMIFIYFWNRFQGVLYNYYEIYIPYKSILFS